jgi:uncharacterized protein
MKRIVLDTVIFVHALINPHGRWGDLVFLYADRYLLITAHPLVVELLDVLRRREVNRKFRVVADLDIGRLLALLEEAELVDVGDVPAASREAKDNVFLAAAIAGSADYLVSEDTDLLDLVRFEGVEGVDALTFLRILDQETRPGSSPRR